MTTSTTQINLTRLRLAARAWSRICGGYGFLGNWKGMTRGVLLGSVLWTALVAMPRFFQLEPGSECLSLECVLTPSDLQILVNYSFVLVLVLFPTEIFIKPWARSMPITDELRALATSGVPEAAFALAELYTDQGAEGQARIWLTKAAELGHRNAIKQLKRLQK